MTAVPPSLEAAIAQALTATQTALANGVTRLQVELAIPEIALQAQDLARQFAPLFPDLNLRVLFPDAGAAALARRDWGETPFQVSDLGSRYTPVDAKIADTDEAYLVVAPTAVEVLTVERLCQLAGDRPVVLLIPQLEDVAIVGIGYAARQLRDRFLSSLTTSYYLRPLEQGAVLRVYPGLWQVYLSDETNEEGYRLIAEEPQKPLGEALETILMAATAPSGEGLPNRNSRGLLTQLGQFLRALNQ